MTTSSALKSVFDERLLRGSLESALSEHSGRACHVIELTRRPFPYETSSPLEELFVELADGETIKLLFKDLSPAAIQFAPGHVKPPFLSDPCREIEAYRGALAERDFGTAKCYGCVMQPAFGRFGLFLELVCGSNLWQVGELETWRNVARWLGKFHQFWSGRANELSRVAPKALRYDPAYYRVWLNRATAFAASPASPYSSNARQSFVRLVHRFDEVIERLATLPVTLLHGDFFASNVLVVGDGHGQRVCPIDWELNGIGPGLVDLAALVAGKWTDHEREILASDYAAAYALTGDTAVADDFQVALSSCRLHLAVRMLGWSPDWRPPAEHEHNWMHEALQQAEQLGLLQ